MQENFNKQFEMFIQGLLSNSFTTPLIEQYLKGILVEINPKFEHNLVENFRRSKLSMEQEINQKYTIKREVMADFLKTQPNCKKIYFELIRPESFLHSELNTTTDRLMFAIFTDLNKIDKYILTDTKSPILITDKNGDFIFKDVFSSKLLPLMDDYANDYGNIIVDPKTKNTRIIALDREKDINTSMKIENEDVDFIEIVPGIISDSPLTTLYGKINYSNQYTLIIKGIKEVISEGSSITTSKTPPFDTFCLNPPDNC